MVALRGRHIRFAADLLDHGDAANNRLRKVQPLLHWARLTQYGFRGALIGAAVQLIAYRSIVEGTPRRLPLSPRSLCWRG